MLKYYLSISGQIRQHPGTGTHYADPRRDLLRWEDLCILETFTQNQFRDQGRANRNDLTRHDHPGPIRGKYPGLVIPLDQSEVSK